MTFYGYTEVQIFVKGYLSLKICDNRRGRSLRIIGFPYSKWSKFMLFMKVK